MFSSRTVYVLKLLQVGNRWLSVSRGLSINSSQPGRMPTSSITFMITRPDSGARISRRLNFGGVSDWSKTRRTAILIRDNSDVRPSAVRHRIAATRYNRKEAAAPTPRTCPYPSGGCLVGSIHRSPLHADGADGTEYRVHNLGRYIVEIEAPRAIASDSKNNVVPLIGEANTSVKAEQLDWSRL